MKIIFCISIALVSLTIDAAQVDKAKLKFKVSARNLPDEDTGLGTTDGYFEFYKSEDGGRTKTKVSRSDTINDQENPDWGTVFDFDFDRSKNPMWFFMVYDNDPLGADENVGRVWVNVADYVDKGQVVNANLDKKRGYLVIKSVEPQKPSDSNTPVGSIPLAAGTPATQTLRFKISASGLPTKDDVGFVQGSSDPYVIVTAVDGVSGKEREVGKTSTVSSSSNPNWGDVLTFNWDQKKDQRLHFKIYDDDKLREDDKLGSGWVEVNDYVAKGQTYTLALPKKGFLTLTKA